MARVLRSIPEHMYLRGFPGLSEALAEFGLVEGDQATFLIDRAITHWNLETKPYLHLQATDDGPTLLKRLTTLRKCLRTIEYAMGTHSEDHSWEFDDFYYLEVHNFPALISRFANELAGKPNTGRSSRTFLAGFLAQIRTMVQAAESLETLVKAEVSKSGPRGHVWYDWFAMAAIEICEQNGIKPTISTDRMTGQRGGRFVEIAERLEKLLPSPMHSPNRQALAQRLKRSRPRILGNHRSPKRQEARATKASRFPF